jgi:uncharacterized membrane protein HdeD (DUF308 family)
MLVAAPCTGGGPMSDPGVQAPRADVDRRVWWTILVQGVAAIVFGLLTLMWPDLTLWALVVLFGAYVLVDGVSVLLDVFTGNAPRDDRAVLVFQGLAGVAAGIVTLVWPDITALALLFLIAAWAFVRGAMEIVAAVRYRRELRHEWLLGVSGVLSIVFGLLLVITPGAGALVITWLIGWYALVVGVVLLALAWRFRALRSGGREVPGPSTSGRGAAAAPAG